MKKPFDLDAIIAAPDVVEELKRQLVAQLKDAPEIVALRDDLARLLGGVNVIPSDYLEPGTAFLMKRDARLDFSPRFTFRDDRNVFSDRLAALALCRPKFPPPSFFAGIFDDTPRRLPLRERVLARKRIDKKNRRARIKAENARHARRKR